MAWMDARYDGKCVDCGEMFDAGERIVFDDEGVHCSDCGEEVEGSPDPEEE